MATHRNPHGSHRTALALAALAALVAAAVAAPAVASSPSPAAAAGSGELASLGTLGSLPAPAPARAAARTRPVLAFVRVDRDAQIRPRGTGSVTVACPRGHNFLTFGFRPIPIRFIPGRGAVVAPTALVGAIPRPNGVTLRFRNLSTGETAKMRASASCVRLGSVSGGRTARAAAKPQLRTNVVRLRVAVGPKKKKARRSAKVARRSVSVLCAQKETLPGDFGWQASRSELDGVSAFREDGRIGLRGRFTNDTGERERVSFYVSCVRATGGVQLRGRIAGAASQTAPRTARNSGSRPTMIVTYRKMKKPEVVPGFPFPDVASVLDDLPNHPWMGAAPMRMVDDVAWAGRFSSDSQRSGALSRARAAGPRAAGVKTGASADVIGLGFMALLGAFGDQRGLDQMTHELRRKRGEVYMYGDLDLDNLDLVDRRQLELWESASQVEEPVEGGDAPPPGDDTPPADDDDPFGGGGDFPGGPEADAYPGDPDPSFGDGGIVHHALSAGSDNLNDIALQPDGKIVGVGSVGGNFAVARFNADGSRDFSFAIDGLFKSPFGTGSSVAGAVEVDPVNGKIVVAGIASGSGSGFDFLAVRLNPAGSLDTGFGSGGSTLIPIAPGSGTDSARGIVLQSRDGDDEIVLAGSTIDLSGDDGSKGALVNLQPDGTLDSTFGSFGIATFAFAPGLTGDGFEAAAPGPGGSIVLGGSSGDDVLVVKTNADGVLDGLFGVGGHRIVDFGEINEVALDVAVDPTGNVVAVGQGHQPEGDTNTHALVTRLTPDGSLDAAFNGTGKRAHDLGSEEDAFEAVLIHNGKVLAMGIAHKQGTKVRYKFDGGLDELFGGGDGIAEVPKASGETQQRIHAGAVLPDGRILVAGNSTPGNGDPSDWFLEVEFGL